MKKIRIIKWLALITLLALNLQPSTALAQGTTAFTYQGQLHDGGTNANGAYTMIFKLYDDAVFGSQINNAITNNSTLANGLFTVNLDFGAGAFNGSARWLDITVQSGSDSEELTPRVQVLPAPYAQFAAVAATVTNGAIMNAQLAGNAVNTTNIQNGAVTTVQLANGAVTNQNLAANAVAATNLIFDSAGLARVTGGAASVTGNPWGTGNTVEFNTGLLTLAFSGTGGSSIWDIANGYSEVLGVPGSLIDNLFFIGPSGLPAAQIWDSPATGARGISALNVFGNTVSASNIVATGTFYGNGAGLTNLSAVAIPNIKVFMSSGTFVVPDGVTRIMVELWGGGGGGGSGCIGTNYNGTNSYTLVGYSGGGGGAGGYGWNVFNVIPGASYTVTIPPDNDGDEPGGTTSFGDLLSATGGSPGADATSNGDGLGGTGGISTGGLVNFHSGYGFPGWVGGKGGGAWRGGSGGAGSGPGSGGNGGNPGNSGIGGGSGVVIIYY